MHNDITTDLLFTQPRDLSNIEPGTRDCNKSPTKEVEKPHKKMHATVQLRSIFISDVHLGTKDCKASQLNDFLKHYSCENLFLVGDIFDGWKMKTGIHWKTSYNRVLRRILKLSKQGVNIIYITGNHDEFLRKYANNSFENIRILNRYTHVTANKRRLLVIHGDQFESVTHYSKLWKTVGDVGYDYLMFLNRWYNWLRSRFGLGYWSAAEYLKANIKRAKHYILAYEKAVSYGAKKLGYDGVVCGHIHHAAIKEIEGIAYFNTGDWVESCTAIGEHHDGNMQLIYWREEPAHATLQKKRSRRAAALKKSERQKDTV